MTRDETISPNVRKHLDELEKEVGGHFPIFERVIPVEILDDALHRISLLERVRIFIVYPDSDFVRKNRHIARHLWVEMQKYYKTKDA